MQDVKGLARGATGEGFGRFYLLAALVLSRTEAGVASLVMAVASWFLCAFLATADGGGGGCRW